ncbi:MAG: hypothetical protein Q7R35_13005 [Elusimicrobiota bacterium]|nr:hypothetical protein [Elusimicrobiota bacterium]
MTKDLAVIIAGRFLQAVLGIAALRVMTALLSPAQVGSVFLVLSFATGFAFLFINPLGMYINRKLHAWHGAKTIIPRFFLFNLYVAVVACAALLTTVAAKKVLGTGAGLPDWSFAALVAAYVYFNTWNMTLVPSLNMLGYRVSFVAYSVLTTGFGLVFSVLAVNKLSPTVFSWLSGQVAAMFLISLAALYSLSRNTGEALALPKNPFSEVNRESARGVLDFALPLSGATIFMWMQNQGYRLIVEMKAGAEFLGYLAVGLGIAASLAAVSESLVQQIYFPGFYKRISSGGAEERKEALAELSAKTIPVYVILLFFTVSVSAQLTGLLVDPKFHNAVKFVAFGSLVEFLRMAANIISSAAHSEMRTKTLIKPYAAGGLVTCAAVFAASGSPSRETLIPLAMILGGLVTLAAIRLETARVVSFSLNRKLVLKTVACSAPLLVFILFRELVSPAWSFAILSAAGLYFLFLQYLVAFRWTPGLRGAAPAGLEAPVAGTPGEYAA